MPSFDLTLKPWIPVTPREGPPRDVSLREALVEAHTFREITSGSPLEALTLYRLLQALFLRLFGKETLETDRWHAMRKAGAFSDREKRRIEAYFDDQRERFDLLHPERPFYQHPEPLASSSSPLAKLFSAEASGNNPTLFHHALDDVPHPRSLAEAARGIVALQGTALGGGRSKPFYYSDAPLAGGAIFWLHGASLFEALLLNSPPSERGRIDSDEDDEPAWERERDDLPVPEDIVPRAEDGYLDYLTWQSRLLRIEAETTGSGEVVATEVWMSQGDKLDNRELHDPLMAYRHNKKSGTYPFKMRKDRALWRDAHIFYSRFSPEKGGTPPALDWVAENLPKQAWQVDVFGMVNDQAKIELWRQERLPLFPVILCEKGRQGCIGEAIERTELQAKNLRRGCFIWAARLLFPEKDPDQKNPNAPDYLGKKAREKARALADGLDAEARYWARLETPFYEWLGKLAIGEPDFEHLLAEWSRTLHREALHAYGEATESLDTSARHLRARAAGRREIRAPRAYATALQSNEVPA